MKVCKGGFRDSDLSNMPPQVETREPSETSTYPYSTPRELKPDEIEVDGHVYDALELSRTHPGGELFVRAFGGRDATDAFMSYHRREFPHQKMEYAYKRRLAPRKKASVDAEFLELCELVNAVLRGNSFAPISYWVKCFVLLGTTLALEMYMHTSQRYTFATCGAVGWGYALIGLNVQHDANHGALSKHGWVNRAFGLSQNFIGGSAVDWIHQHVVQHHINTNDVKEDPDIEGSSLVRLNPVKRLLHHQRMQHVYVFILLAMFGFTTVVNSFLGLCSGVRYTPMSDLVSSYRMSELVWTFLFVGRWVVMPLLTATPLASLLATAPLYMVAGYYLAFFFILSHNYEGVHMYDKSQKPQGSSFLRNQVLSSSNVGGSWLCWLNGGLNYQIEHHLFPRIQHTHYPKIAPIVRAFCAKKGIRYTHFPTIAENYMSCVRHLRKMGAVGDAVEPVPGH